MSTEKDMIEYIRTGLGANIGCITPIFLTLALFLIIVAVGAMFGGGGGGFFAGLVLLLIGIMLGKVAIYPIQNRMNGYKPLLSLLKARNIYDEALADFAVARPFMEDRVRLGDKFIFGRYCSCIIMYKDIVRIYQHVLKVNSYESDRELMAVDVHGITWSVCKIKLHKEFDFSGSNAKIDEQLLEVMQVILYKNNAVSVGYDK